ncbi:winged helix DNA-binding domain-containing protein [Streptomyces sp. NPDC048002]|uniref:winged helix DNA-binding domain-containing protein n=1 Tax=unclassified Streptomyces TaxID=2593676 RepID=UPI0033E05010
MKISVRELNRATLGRQLLLRREPLEAAEAVRRLPALQAQQPASPYLALWNRIAGFAPADLDAAFADGTLLKATLLRITLHAVHRDDYPLLREAMRPTLHASRLGSRFAAAGLTPADAGELEPGLLEFAEQPRSNGELTAWLGARVGAERQDGAWWGMRSYAPLVHAVTGPPWSFGTSPAYRAGPGDRYPGGPEEALRALVPRYLAAFGPASVADMAQFATVQRGRVRTAVRALADSLEELTGPDGTVLYDLPGAPRPSEDTPAPPRLMAMWDSVLLAHADRGRVIPPEYRAPVTRVNGDVLPTLLVDGRVAGVWRPVEGGIEATAFHPLSAADWEGLAAEAESLTALLADREPGVYGRYGHWWKKLTGAEVRVLPA